MQKSCPFLGIPVENWQAPAAVTAAPTSAGESEKGAATEAPAASATEAPAAAPAVAPAAAPAEESPKVAEPSEATNEQTVGQGAWFWYMFWFRSGVRFHSG